MKKPKLTLKQTRAYDALESNQVSELIFGGGVHSGKTFFGGMILVLNALKYKGSAWGMGRSDITLLKKTTLVTFRRVCDKLGLRVNIDYTENQSLNTINFKNGSIIYIIDMFQYPSDPLFTSQFNGYELTGCFVDECTEVVHKAWTTMITRIRYKVGEYCHVCGSTEMAKILEEKDDIPQKWICDKGHESKGLIGWILGTCNPAKNWVYTEFYQPWKHGEIGKGDYEGKMFIQALAQDNPYTTDQYMKNMIRSNPPEEIERLVKGNWEYDSDPRNLISQEAINNVFANHHVRPDLSKHRLSADLATSGRDRFVVCHWQGGYVRIDVDSVRNTALQIEEDLVKLMKMYSIPPSKVIYDSAGQGNYLGDYLKGTIAFHSQHPAFNKDEFKNLKTECAYKLAEKINKGELKIVCSKAQELVIRQELGVLKAKDIDADESKKSIISKDEMKETLRHSPDYLDALLMGMYYEIQDKPLKVFVFPKGFR